ncbi:hypothetical protein SY27_08540 [Flavobacterium sp. 316]|uniref:Uncharacterized protein n=1 Tax=Flavobacterium sediminilitoris TaxID=2024526 RepID=A0ABY4HNQ7_9FLAO|nr:MULTISPECIES: hypothetical protein [Flavobacterium]KIX21719.1 hypothetical protein SY27_08540 [Flavobacterium sp. 316]UOX34496.1 hypothetical protein LXD69_03050 [Flavobacterium sediminilitoris]
MKLVIVFLLMFSNLLFTQSTMVVLCDKNDKLPIEYASIDFLNGYGIYSGEDGYIDYVILPEKFMVSHLNYKSQTLIKNEIKDTIFLELKENFLDEVFVVKKNKIAKIGKEKIKKCNNHSDYQKSIVPSMGLEVCFYLENKETFDIVLKSIQVPYINTSFEFKDKKQKLMVKDFNNLLKITVYSVINGKPFEELKEMSMYKIINSNELRKDSFEIDFQDPIPLPNGGLFVSIKFIGRVDEYKNLILELPYEIVNYNGEVKKISKNLMPLLPLEETESDISYLRYEFSNSKNWHTIDDYNFRNKNKETINKRLKVPIGYKILLYK